MRPFGGGFVTDVYSFELDDAPSEWSGPLVLRVYPPDTERLEVQRERCAQEVVAAQGVPAPRVVAYDDTPAFLDAPYIVMERMPGKPQMRIDFPRIFVEIPKLFTLARRHAAAMFIVHELDAEPLLTAFESAGIDRRNAGPDHWLDRSEQLMHRWGFAGLEPGLAWLRANRPTAPARLSICHGDLFGANILEVGGKVTGIVDWNLVTVADRALDLGGQIAASEMSAIEGPRALQVVALGVGRSLARGLRRAYGERADVSEEAVIYYAVMRAFTELTYKVAMEAEIRETGVARRLPTWRPSQCAAYFKRRTGVTLSWTSD